MRACVVLHPCRVDKLKLLGAACRTEKSSSRHKREHKHHHAHKSDREHHTRHSSSSSSSPSSKAEGGSGEKEKKHSSSSSMRRRADAFSEPAATVDSGDALGTTGASSSNAHRSARHGKLAADGRAESADSFPATATAAGGLPPQPSSSSGTGAFPDNW